MKCTASAVIAIAKEEIGYLEKKSGSGLGDKTANAGSGNYTKYARDLDAIEGFYNGKKQGYAWCDVFVDWCFVQAFGAEKAKALLCQPDKSYGAGVDWSARYFKQAGRLHTGDPKAGDQIFFLDSSGEPGHTGIVTAVEGGRVHTIEGNTSGETGVVDNGGGVWAKSYALSDPKICGYGRPDYDPASFADVPESAWYAEAAEYCLAQGLMVGVGAEKFEPNRPVTRAELAAVAARMHKRGTP